MADTATKGAKGAAKTTASTDTAKTPKPQAIVDTIDFSTAMDDSELTAPARRSKWNTILEALYDATVAEDSKVPRNEAGELKFIKLGVFTNVNGARTQARALEQKGLGDTYEFKTVAKATSSELYARVIELDEAPAAE